MWTAFFQFFSIIQNVEFTSPTAVILALSSEDDMEDVDKLDVADISDLKKQLNRPFDGLSYEELRASFGSHWAWA